MISPASPRTWRVAVRDHVLIAHSLRGAVFGPAQRMHGATYEITAEVAADRLDAHGIVIDIGLFQGVLGEALTPLRFQNLDELPAFAGRNTTTEFLAEWLHGRIAEKLRGAVRGTLRVTLEESRVAEASFEAPLPA